MIQSSLPKEVKPQQKGAENARSYANTPLIQFGHKFYDLGFPFNLPNF